MSALRALHFRHQLIQLALACLLLTQTLGLLHRAVHIAQGQGAIQVESSQAKAVGIAALFSGHDKDFDCQLFDQMAHVDLAAAPVSAWACDVGSSALVAAAFCSHLLAHERAACARGPPASA